MREEIQEKYGIYLPLVPSKGENYSSCWACADRDWETKASRFHTFLVFPL